MDPPFLHPYRSPFYPSLAILILTVSTWFFPDQDCGNEDLREVLSCPSTVWIWESAIIHVAIIFYVVKRQQIIDILDLEQSKPPAIEKIIAHILWFMLALISSKGIVDQIMQTSPFPSKLSLFAQARKLIFLLANCLGIIAYDLDVMILTEAYEHYRRVVRPWAEVHHEKRTAEGNKREWNGYGSCNV
ncbi:hypothetical protein M422DRAFT_251650 [Sphaerobolus stellatus SS14]|uniref:Uncharacterized protein n=1 Tax=Sphaerobolus stellatus (strain SS14) TaxID=990650 RepID=A0A0C9W215_SPHS4|nr:hypothetical protein M422DRAFT_251650 [Sphaerobolus stellatus SS14]